MGRTNDENQHFWCAISESVCGNSTDKEFKKKWKRTRWAIFLCWPCPVNINMYDVRALLEEAHKFLHYSSDSDLVQYISIIYTKEEQKLKILFPTSNMLFDLIQLNSHLQFNSTHLYIIEFDFDCNRTIYKPDIVAF